MNVVKSGYQGLLFLLVTTLLFSCSPDTIQDVDQETNIEQETIQPLAPLLEGIGDYTFPIKTTSELAQKYFNQGLIFTYGFNHTEAERAFREAVRQDPKCSICYWGIALVLGPNYNKKMPPENNAAAIIELGNAILRNDVVDSREIALINALVTRYRQGATEDRADLDRAYANSMAKLAELFPEDPDLLTLYAESLMNLSPWGLYDKAGEPTENTNEILAVLEKAIAISPKHPGALHYYIHATESSKTPQMAYSAALALGPLVPVSGHLVHMPSHTYLRMGRYHDAVIANQQAIAADETYVNQCNVSGFSADPYYPHNLHFLWYAAMMGGERELALQSADELLTSGDQSQYATIPLLTKLRFGQWQESLDQATSIESNLAEKLNDENKMSFHFSRSVAYAKLGQLELAQSEFENMMNSRQEDLTGDKKLIEDIYQHVAKAILAEANNDQETRISEFIKAVASQDELSYMEPPWFFYPVRESLGKAYMQNGESSKATEVFRADLKINVNSGWSFYGLNEIAKSQNNRIIRVLQSNNKGSIWQYGTFERTTPSYL